MRPRVGFGVFRTCWEVVESTSPSLLKGKPKAGVSLPELLDFELLWKTNLVVDKNFKLCSTTQEVR